MARQGNRTAAAAADPAGPSAAKRAQEAFARGDFAAVKRLSPTFVATAPGGGRAPEALFAASRLVRGIGAISLLLVAIAWAYALTRR